MNPEAERQFIAELEKQGETRVRDNLAHGHIAPAWGHVASTWLSEKERESERRREASNSEQIDLMRRASTAAERQAIAAERANTRATIALVIAILSMIVSAIGIWMPFWSTHK